MAWSGGGSWPGLRSVALLEGWPCLYRRDQVELPQRAREPGQVRPPRPIGDAVRNPPSSIPINHHDRQVGSSVRHEQVPGVQVRVPPSRLVTSPDRPADIFHQDSQFAFRYSEQSLSGRYRTRNTTRDETCRIPRTRPDPLLDGGQNLRHRGPASAESLVYEQLTECTPSSQVTSLYEVADPAAPPIRPDDDIPERPG